MCNVFCVLTKKAQAEDDSMQRKEYYSNVGTIVDIVIRFSSIHGIIRVELLRIIHV